MQIDIYRPPSFRLTSIKQSENSEGFKKQDLTLLIGSFFDGEFNRIENFEKSLNFRKKRIVLPSVFNKNPILMKALMMMMLACTISVASIAQTRKDTTKKKIEKTKPAKNKQWPAKKDTTKRDTLKRDTMRKNIQPF